MARHPDHAHPAVPERSQEAELARDDDIGCELHHERRVYLAGGTSATARSRSVGARRAPA
jgi:hypothetical protein